MNIFIKSKYLTLIGIGITAVATIIATNWDTIFPPLQKPIAIAGGDDNANERDTFRLNGDASHTDNGDITGYQWTYVRGPEVEIATPNNSRVILTAPEVDRNSDLAFQLLVVDAKGLQNTDEHSVTIENLNEAPEVSINGSSSSIVNLKVDENEEYIIPVGITDDSRGQLHYEWGEVRAPEGFLKYLNPPNLLINVPVVDNDTEASLELTVNDAEGLQSTRLIKISINNTDDIIPTSHGLPSFGMGLTRLLYVPKPDLHFISTENNPNLSNDTSETSMIYPTQENGQTWELQNSTDMNRTDLYGAEMVENADGSWNIRATSDNPSVTYYVYTTQYAKEKPHINESDHSVFEDRGYIFDPTDWRDVEVTSSIKINEITDENQYFATDTRGARHNEEQPCLGTSYRNQLSPEGDLQFRKEQWHPFFVSSEINNIGDIIGQWIGLKTIVYNLQNETGKQVKMETYVDLSNTGNNWIKIAERIDNGDWGDAGEECNGNPDQIISWGAPAVSFYFNGIVDADIKDFSVREIQPPVSLN